MIPYFLPEKYGTAPLAESNFLDLYDKTGEQLYINTDYNYTPKDLRMTLPDALSCEITQEINGEYELEMTYPVDGLNFSALKTGRIIVAANYRLSQSESAAGITPLYDVNNTPIFDSNGVEIDVGSERAQPFRIYTVAKNIDGTATINARHIVYDLSGVVVAPYHANSKIEALAGLKKHALSYVPFFIDADNNRSVPFSVEVPTTVWDLMGGTEGSLLDVYGGEYEFNWNRISLVSRVGHDTNILVEYGRNLTDFEQEESLADCYTGVVAYWTKNEDVVISHIVSSSIPHDHTRILPVDMTDKFDGRPSATSLDAAAQRYVRDNNIGVPAVAWTIDFIPLEDTVEYAYLASKLGSIRLGDTIRVKFSRYDVNVTARVYAIKWDVLMERIVSVSLGGVRQDITGTIARQAKAIGNMKRRY